MIGLFVCLQRFVRWRVRIREHAALPIRVPVPPPTLELTVRHVSARDLVHYPESSEPECGI